MVVERRVFNRLPDYLKTDQNNRDTYISDDVMFEPERAGFVNGYIGETDILTEKDLERTPLIVEDSPERQKYQLSLAAVYVDPDTDDRSGGAFYPDLVQQIYANGGIVDDPNRLFETPFYAWSPPIDYDKHINFGRYYWTGDGNAEVNGEYVTKEPQGSQTVLYQFSGGSFIKKEATIGDTPPGSPDVGDLWEDTSSNNRIIKRWDGSIWSGIPFVIRDNLPVDTTPFHDDDYVYVTRTGPDYNRPLIWKYATESGRWIAQPVIVGPVPDNPVENMLWEDSSSPPNRVLKIYKNGFFSTLSYTTANGPSGVAVDNTYVYDTRLISELDDEWSTKNWWRHFQDLSPADRGELQTGDQAIRPILEFWAGIESPSGDTREFRNDSPLFNVYSYNLTADDIINTGSTTTLFQYRIGTGGDDLVLGFPLVFNNTGEFQFELTLETDTIPDAVGYRYFRDTFTGYTHSIWAKSDVNTVQEIDVDGLAEVPRNITSNADHEILTIASRSRLLRHMAGNISAQAEFSGNNFGLNSYRWTDKSPTVGSTIIDCENSLLRTLATLQRSNTRIPDVIRHMSRDYNRVLFKFKNRLEQLWDNLVLSDPAGTLLVSADEAVDTILTELFIGRGSDFSYYYADMGTYRETQVSSGTAFVYGTEDRPIFIPPSPSRIGAYKTFKPEKFTDTHGQSKLRGHEGVIIDAYDDDRDQVWLALQNRFFERVPDYYKEETTDFSARHAVSNFWLDDFYGNSIPSTTVSAVDQVVPDHTTIPTPVAGTVVFDTSAGVFAYYNGTKFLTKPALADEIFLNEDDSEYYIYNGFGCYKIDRWNNSFDFDYSTEEFKQILRREFERWAVSQDIDFVTNDQFDENDPFTWNYRSAGTEGYYKGIYRRIYRTVHPHSHPWEIVGYSVEPNWWRTEYPPTSIASDGTPRYANTNPMWLDLQSGIYFKPTGDQSDQFIMAAPIPVDDQGELLDPITAGVVDEDKLVPDRRDDAWVYGDGGPAEQEFWNSSSYAFAVALQGYLMKPGLYVDTIWSDLYIDVGLNGSNPLWRAPHVVHRETLTRPSVNDLSVHLEEVDGEIQPRLGLNAWISEHVKALGNDVDESFGKIIRNTQISVGWRCAGFINQDRTIIQTLSGIKIPFEDVHTILHRSPPTREMFGSGVFVAREGTGYRVFGYDLFRPYFEIDPPVVPISGGQVELREEFIADQDQHQFTTTSLSLPRNVQDGDTAKLSVLVNGLRLKSQHITVTGKNTFEIEDIVTINAGDIVLATVLTTQSNPSTRTKQFQIDGVSFPYIDQGQGTIQRVDYGTFFETSTDVINFMLAYGRKLEQDGWIFEHEVSPGQFQDWLFGAKQFAQWVLDTRSPWQPNGPSRDIDFFFSPFAREAKFRSEFGQILNVEALQNGAYGILDLAASPISPDDIFTSRIGNEITLGGQENAADMYGVRLLIAEDQHVVFFSNITKFNDLIYDPVIAVFQSTLRLDSYRSSDWNGRLEADGFIINQDQILPNFEKQARDFTRYYDRINTLDDPVKRDQARELYGWYPLDTFYPVFPLEGDPIPMMDAIGADDRSRFDFHRGMLHSKGSIRPIIAFSRGTRLGQDSVLVNEDWAWRWCEFGDTRRNIVQFNLTKNDVREQIQVISFNEEDILTDDILQVEQFDRNNPNEGRWIIPPIAGDEDQCCLYSFPVKEDGTFNTETTRFFVKLFDTDNNFTILRLFHFDPQNDLFDPRATCEIDYISHLDPARYSDGSGAAYSNDIEWGENQVGHLWWDQSRLAFTDYRSQAPDYNEVAQEWGKLKYFNGTINRIEEVATVETLDPYTGAVVSHGLETGDEIEITGAIPPDYNGLHTITVSSPTTFEFVVDDEYTTPATGDIEIRVGFVDLYEWVRSPVPPSGWETYVENLSGSDAPTGTPINGDDTSYVQREIINTNGTTSTRYYFWITGNTGDNLEKNLPTATIASRLSNPTRNNIGWFSHIDQTRMLMFVDGEVVRDDNALEIVQDQRELDHHAEWLLISEGDQFHTVPETIKEKLLSSLTGEDEDGRPVPSLLLADTEKLGSEEFPPQTVFADRAEAISVYVSAINTILKRKNLNTFTNIDALFPLADEGTYWERANYRDEEYENRAILDTVATENIRQDRLENKRYFSGDLVKVVQSTNTDLWDGSTVGTTYVLNNGSFSSVGVDNHTIRVILDETTDPAILRNTFDTIYEILTKNEQNSLIFSLLYEMLRQTPDADWFMKTSYITAQVFDEISQSPFVRPNEVEAVIASILEMKPYRTKLRISALTYSLAQIEEFNVRIDEFVDKKIGLWFDRLNCDAIEDGGWDGLPWDTEWEGWDKPIWDWVNLGRGEYYSLGTQSGGPGKVEFVFASPYDPTLYDHTVILRQSGEIINPTNIGLSYELFKEHHQLRVVFSGTISSGYTVEVQQNSGFYDGSEPSLGQLSEDTLFQAAPSSYRHHIARAFDAGLQAPIPSLDECYLDPPQSPQERIANDAEDSMVICVRNLYTGAYAGWDTTPWDSTGWDLPPNNIGQRVFYIMAGNEEIIPPGVQIFSTTEDVIATDERFVPASNPYRIADVAVNGTILQIGTDYSLVEETPWVAEFPPRDDIIYTADGATTSFDVSAAATGVEDVYRNGILLTDGVDYNVVGTDVVFVQPPPTVLSINAYPTGRDGEGTGSTTEYVTGHDDASLNVVNTFIFNNGLLVGTADYSVATTEDIVFDSPPANGNELLFFTIGNDAANSDPVFIEFTDVGDGGTASYVVGNNANQNTAWVFLDGQYQVLGTDYTIPAIGTIQFTAPVPGGVNIYIRILDPSLSTYDIDHVVFNASGGVSDPIPGIFDANPDNMIVFVGNDPQNGYSATDVDFTITDGVPDSINWDSAPLAGTPITVRIIRSIEIDQAVLINVVPVDGDQVRITQNPTVGVGDTVTFYYDQFPVGPFGLFRVDSVPTTYDIVDGMLTMDNPVLGGTVTLTYSEPRRASNPTSILSRLVNVAELARDDHTIFDPTQGFHLNRVEGLRILNTTDARIYEWDGDEWLITTTTFSAGDQILVRLDQQILEYDGSNFNVVFNTGDSFTTPPVLEYPLWGTGIVSGTYSLGQISSASSDFPEPYQIYLHTGNCTGAGGVLEPPPPPPPPEPPAEPASGPGYFYTLNDDGFANPILQRHTFGSGIGATITYNAGGDTAPSDFRTDTAIYDWDRNGRGYFQGPGTGFLSPATSMFEFSLYTLEHRKTHDLTVISDGQAMLLGLDKETGYLVGAHAQGVGGPYAAYVYDPITETVITDTTFGNQNQSVLAPTPDEVGFVVITDTGSGNAAVLSTDHITRTNVHTFPALAYQQSFGNPNAGMLWKGGPTTWWNAGSLNNGADGEAWINWTSPDEIRFYRYDIDGVGNVTETDVGGVANTDIDDTLLFNPFGLDSIPYYNNTTGSLILFVKMGEDNGTTITEDKYYVFSWHPTTGLDWSIEVSLFESNTPSRQTAYISNNRLVVRPETFTTAFDISPTTGVTNETTLPDGGGGDIPMIIGSGTWTTIPPSPILEDGEVEVFEAEPTLIIGSTNNAASINTAEVALPIGWVIDDGNMNTAQPQLVVGWVINTGNMNTAQPSVVIGNVIVGANVNTATVAVILEGDI